MTIVELVHPNLGYRPNDDTVDCERRHNRPMFQSVQIGI
jgi:hypothetical protein